MDPHHAATIEQFVTFGTRPRLLEKRWGFVARLPRGRTKQQRRARFARRCQQERGFVAGQLGRRYANRCRRTRRRGHGRRRSLVALLGRAVGLRRWRPGFGRCDRCPMQTTRQRGRRLHDGCRGGHDRCRHSKDGRSRCRHRHHCRRSNCRHCRCHGRLRPRGGSCEPRAFDLGPGAQASVVRQDGFHIVEHALAIGERARRIRGEHIAANLSACTEHHGATVFPCRQPEG